MLILVTKRRLTGTGICRSTYYGKTCWAKFHKCNEVVKMDCFCHIICPCLCAGQSELEKSYDVIPEKGEYYGDTNMLGAKHGHGIFLFSQGDIYEGDWKDDKMHGFGEYRFHDGKILNGYFENGNFIGNPPPGVRPKSATGKTRPLEQSSIGPNVQPTTVKHNEVTYAFARTVGALTQTITTKKSKSNGSKDTVDYEEQRPFIVKTSGQNQNRVAYDSVATHANPGMAAHANPAIAAQITMEREKKERLRRERIARIKEKYNIKK